MCSTITPSVCALTSSRTLFLEIQLLLFRVLRDLQSRGRLPRLHLPIQGQWAEQLQNWCLLDLLGYLRNRDLPDLLRSAIGDHHRQLLNHPRGVGAEDEQPAVLLPGVRRELQHN